MYELHATQLAVISVCIEIEKLVVEIHAVADRCIDLYNKSDTRSVRQKQFDELTCMLGEGRPPTMGGYILCSTA
jgi:hypothetical protein